ncbi:MAG TPA: GNAT family N-acetyltransferase [Gemmatimonadaceae bacterium]|nr:GNAT family N-acetyltransferase [Gemmatimonadaceae bacterium]
MTDSLRIDPATPVDVPLLVEFIRELAEYERLAHEVRAKEVLLHDALFGPRPVVEAIIARLGDEPAGWALYFHNFSTFLTRKGLYIEDLYVRPAKRGRGIGSRLLAELARIAIDRQCGRLEWTVLDWNEPAIRFYRSLGAEPMDGWTVHRVAGEPLRRLAAEVPEPRGNRGQ